VSESFTLAQLHQAVMGVIEQIIADHAAYPLVVEPEGRNVVDHATQVNPYLQVAIEVLDGEQAELGQNPNVKRWGQILLTAVVKDGNGTLAAKQLLDFAMPYFSTQVFGALQCQAAYPVRGREFKGLWYQPVIIPFFYFSRQQ
jgi:hypothetical protein